MENMLTKKTHSHTQIICLESIFPSRLALECANFLQSCQWKGTIKRNTREHGKELIFMLPPSHLLGHQLEFITLFGLVTTFEYTHALQRSRRHTSTPVVELIKHGRQGQDYAKILLQKLNIKFFRNKLIFKSMWTLKVQKFRRKIALRDKVEQ